MVSGEITCSKVKAMDWKEVFEGLPYTKRQYIIMCFLGIILVIFLSLFIAVATQFIANTYDYYIAFAFQILCMILFIVLAWVGKLNRFLEWIFKKVGINPVNR